MAANESLNHLDSLVHDWGWFNRAYTRLLIRARGYRLVKMAETLPAVNSIAELTERENGALFWLEPRQSLHDLDDPSVVLGEHADYLKEYYRYEFAARQDRPFIAYFRHPLLFGRQFSILDRQRHSFEECFSRDRRWREGVPKRRGDFKPKKVPGTYLLAGTEFHNHYAHLFCDVLPRWKLFDDAGLEGKFPALLPPPSQAFAAEAWEKIGLAGEGAQVWDDTCWQLDGLYFASAYKRFCSWTPESAAWMRKRFAPGIESRPVGKKIFYISRTGGARPMLNETEILAALAGHNVTVVRPERWPLEEQVALFANARLIIGPQGAGIQNTLWAPRGCAVLELVNVRFFSGVYWTLTESLGQRYGAVTGISDSGTDPLRQGYTCDPAQVREAVDRLIALGPPSK